MENLPFNQNINVGQAVGLLASILVLVTGGKVNLSMADQAVIIAAIQSGAALYTVIVHTFFNHPENQAKAKAMVAKAVDEVKGKSGALAVLFVLALTVSGCASLGPYFSNPKNDLQLAETGFSVALNLYENLCASNAGASFCTAANIQEAETLEQAVISAIKIAESVLGPDGSVQVSSTTFETDVQNVVSAVQKFSDFVHQLQADKTKAMAARALLAH